MILLRCLEVVPDWDLEDRLGLGLGLGLGLVLGLRVRVKG